MNEQFIYGKQWVKGKHFFTFTAHQIKGFYSIEKYLISVGIKPVYGFNSTPISHGVCKFTGVQVMRIEIKGE